jgi:hypothetical protein
VSLSLTKARLMTVLLENAPKATVRRLAGSAAAGQG